MMSIRKTVLVVPVLAVAAGAALAQQAGEGHEPGPGGHAPASAAPIGGPLAISVYGNFRAMVQTQDFAPKAQLGSLVQRGATEAVGAVAGLRGEITVVAGRLVVTYGMPCPTCGEPGEESATLLAAARVTAWHRPVMLPSDLAGPALDAFIVAQARAAGVDVTRPFPVRMRGMLIGVRMHVLRASNPHFKGHGSGHAMADQEEISAGRLAGDVVGFFAPPSAQGVITHPGEPFHYHWVDTGRTRTAHLDAFGMAKGAELLLPKS